MKSKISLLISLCFLFTSCNRVFLPKKTRVLYQIEGYLFDEKEELLFIPMNPLQDFLKQVEENRNAYKIAGYRDSRSPMYLIKDSLDLTMHYNNEREPKDTFSMKERIYVSRVRITYAPFKYKRVPQRNGRISFDYNNKNYSFISYHIFSGEIYRINALDSAGNIAGLAFD